MTEQEALDRAAEVVASAQAMIVAAGAGMGVDSGLPDFRGDQGFWKAYPPYAKLGLSFISLANPRWFATDPALAWGFYGHRLNLYRDASPHPGFQILLRWAARMPHGVFVFTSNVDGQFQKAGFDPERIVEVHGSICHLQCSKNCGVGIFPVEMLLPGPVEIDESTMRATSPLPACPSCQQLIRPNVLMFNDWLWDSDRMIPQHGRLQTWLERVGPAPLVIVEFGAGLGVPTVRDFSETLLARRAGPRGAKLVRINPREPAVPPGQISLALGGLAATRAIDARLG